MKKYKLFDPEKADPLCEDMETALMLRSQHDGRLSNKERSILEWVAIAYAKAEPVEVSELEKARALMQRLRASTPLSRGGADES